MKNYFIKNKLSFFFDSGFKLKTVFKTTKTGNRSRSVAFLIKSLRVLCLCLFPVVLMTKSYAEIKKPSNIKLNQNQTKTQNLTENKEPEASEPLSPKLYLLDRLENLDRTLPEGYEGKEALQLRLAHVLSLLAEENFKKSKQESCQPCLKQSQIEAKKSLSLYKKLSPLIFSSNQNFLQIELMFQKAYLERILGNRKQALSQLQKIRQRDSLKMDWVIRAWYGIGEIEFELYNYKKALKAFNQVLTKLSKLDKETKPKELGLDKNQLSSWKFKALYHKIWSLFNLSSYDLALNEMLGLISSGLYKNSSYDFWLDKENQILRTKLEKEMLTIYSYASITDKNLQILYEFSIQEPEENTILQKNKRLSQLASSLTSMGRLKKSNKVWQFYLSKDNSKEDQLIAYASIFINSLKLKQNNQLEELGSILEKIFELQKELFPQKRSSLQAEVTQSEKNSAGAKRLLSQSDSKKTSFYDSINLKIKEFFYQVDSKKYDFNKKQKIYLLSLYQRYNAQNSKDKDVLPLSALLAEDLKQYKLAVSLFQQTVLSIDEINQIKELDKKSQMEWRERFCVRQMELAELSKDKITRLKAYDFYVQQGQKMSLKYKAKYQEAYLYHQDQDFSKSQPLFLKLALNDFTKKEFFNKKQSNKKIAKREAPEKELRLNSAHLYLSSLTTQKGREEEIIRSAGLFKKEFPKEKTDFVKIYNLAVLNYVEKLVKGQSFSKAPLVASKEPSVQKAWTVLNLFDFKTSSKENREIYHLNRMILAKELLKINEMDESLNFLISSKGVSKENKKLALEEKLWLAELRFDFESVLSLLKQLKPKDQSKEHALRLIQIAELSDQNPSPYYEDFLNRFGKETSSDTKTPETLKVILVSLLELSGKKKQKDLLKTYHSLFKNNPSDLLYWVLKVDNGEMDLAFLNFFAKNPVQNNSFLTLFLKRKQSLEGFETALLFKKRDPKKVPVSQIARAIKSYSNQLKQLETKALSFLETEDWTTQVFVVGHWVRELKSFYNFVFQLPMPKGLTEAEQADYKKLLVQQMQVYSNKILELEKKQKELFSHPFIATYQKALKSSVFHPYLKWEMNKISKLLSETDQKKMQLLIRQIETSSSLSKKAEMTQSELEQMNSLIQKKYKKLKQNPFDKKTLNAILDLEKKRNNKARVRYLTHRIEQLESKSKRNKSKNKIRDT